MNRAPRSPRVLSASAVSLILAPALLGAAADPGPEPPSHANVEPAQIECDQGTGTVTVVGQLFPTLSQSADGQSELALNMAAELAAEEAGGTESSGATTELELVLVPHAQPLPGITAEEMDEAADRAGVLAAALSGTDGRLLTGDEPPTLTWEDWEPPLGFYEVRVATETFSLPGFGACAVLGDGPLSSVQVGTDDEQGEQREIGAGEASTAPVGWQEHLPWAILVMGVLGSVCLLVPAVLHLRSKASQKASS